MIFVSYVCTILYIGDQEIGLKISFKKHGITYLAFSGFIVRFEFQYHFKISSNKKKIIKRRFSCVEISKKLQWSFAGLDIVQIGSKKTLLLIL